MTGLVPVVTVQYEREDKELYARGQPVVRGATGSTASE